METQNKKTIWIIIGIVILIISILFNIYLKRENDFLMKKDKQNGLALKDMELIKKENEELFHKYISVKDIPDSLNKMLKERNEKILLLTSTIIQLKDIIASGIGTVSDTIKIKECLGLKLHFTNETNFYKYNIDVLVEEPPIHNLFMSFKPIKGMKNFITANKEGIWSSYVEVPPEYRDYITITDLQTIVDDKLFKDSHSIKIPRLSFYLNAGVLTSPAVSLSVGGGIIYDENVISYSKGIANNYHYINYGRIFSSFNF